MKTIVTRLVPTEDGELITYVALPNAAQVCGLSRSAVSRWVRSGAVRSLVSKKRVNGNAVWVALLDVALLKAMPRTRQFELGIVKTPKEDLAYGIAWHETQQTKTKPADHNGEEWCSYEYAYVISAVERGDKVANIALHLGRTHDATSNVIDRLRNAGDLPKRPEDDGAWRELLAAVLPASEMQRFQEDEVTS